MWKIVSNKLCAWPRGDCGQLSIGFVPSLGYRLLPKTLQAYHSKFPDVELQLLEMDTSRQLKEIEDHRLDLGFIELGQSSEKLTELQTVLVAQERLFAVVPQDHPLAKAANPFISGNLHICES